MKLAKKYFSQSVAKQDASTFITISVNFSGNLLVVKFVCILSYSKKGVTCKLSNNFTFYIIKQDSHIYVPYSRPNGRTDWAKIFCGHSWVAGGDIG